MFQEHNNDRQGRIEVICGSMFSGKTEELIRRLKRARIARQRVEIYKPAIDTRYSEADVVSHDANSISSTPVSSAWSILTLASEAEVVGIDEAQFFDDALPNVCQLLADSGKRVIIAGLDMDFKVCALWPNACAHGYCRGCDEGACHLCALWQPGLLVAPHKPRREPGVARRTGIIRTAVPPMLQQTG